MRSNQAELQAQRGLNSTVPRLRVQDRGSITGTIAPALLSQTSGSDRERDGSGCSGIVRSGKKGFGSLSINARFTQKRARKVICSIAAFGVAYAVYRVAWLSDDAYITFRYVRNTLEGHGAVFNLGERVQGFTHPFWFLLLLVGSHITPLESLAVWLSLGLTATAVAILARLYRYRVWETTCFSVLFAASYTFREFQTSGLENALTDVLLAAWLVSALSDGERTPPARRMTWILAWGTLVAFSRLDHTLLVTPLAVYTLVEWIRLPRGERLPGGGPGVVLGLSLAATLGWYLWATFYYGSPLPNTFYAKTGVIPFGARLGHGLAYVADIFRDEPFPACVATASFFGACGLFLRKARRRDDRPALAGLCILLGVLLHLSYVLTVGGDFMRGRFLLSVYFTTVPLGVWALTRAGRQRFPFWVLLLCVSAFCQNFFDPAQKLLTRRVPKGEVITRESSYWRYNKWERIRHEGLRDSEFAVALRDYAERFGPVVVASENIGGFGWVCGPKVSIVDVFGLTDAYVAGLPGEATSRIGHPEHPQPLLDAYLLRKGCIGLTKGWEDRVREMDGSLRENALDRAERERNVQKQ